MFLLLQAARAEEDNPPRRSLPPQWPAEVLEVFFNDARTQLHGKRPTHAASDTRATVNSGHEADNQSDVKWSALVEADTLTAEVKRTHNRLTPLLARPGRFKSGGSVDCRREFSLLATLFGVIDQYDKQTRWQQDAAYASALCTRAADACRETSDESFALAAEVHSQIADLLRGQSFDRQEPIMGLSIDRGQLMQRMEVAVEDNLSARLADNREFRRRKSEVAQESQLLAVLARTICSEGYEFADDDAFLEIAHRLQQASHEMTEANQRGDYGATQQAFGRVIQSCTECHDRYRG